MPTVREVVARFEKAVPKYYAMDRDPIGLHFGDWNQSVQTVMTTLDVRPSVIEEAISKKVDLIIAHHPPIFRPIQQFDVSIPQNRMYQQILKHDIAVYAAHTNLDIVPGGMNDWLAEQLSLSNVQVLSPTQSVKQMKIIVFTPLQHADLVRQAMHQAGGGVIGENYKECSYSTQGIGRFTPVNHASPVIGKLNQAEQVAEEKIEMLCLEHQVDEIIAAMKQAHPYEVPAYEVIALANTGIAVGLGRIGELPVAMSPENFLKHVKEVFQLKGIRYVPAHHSPKMIQRVAICGGAGDRFYQDAVRKKADAYITGDVFYHTAHDAQETPLLLVDAGHHIEAVCISRLAQWLLEWKQEKNWKMDVLESQSMTDPFEFM